MSGKCMCGGWRNDKGDHMSADRYVEYLQARLDEALREKGEQRAQRHHLEEENERLESERRYIARQLTGDENATLEDMGEALIQIGKKGK